MPQATRLRHLLDLAGLIKKRRNKFSLTNKGALILKKEKQRELFETLFVTYIAKWNWGFSDYYPELGLIQSSAMFCFLLIHKKAQNWTEDKVLGHDYLNAFPSLLRLGDGSFEFEKTVRDAFCCRFLMRTCLTWGFLLTKEEGTYGARKVFYKVSPLFKTLFEFHETR